MLRDLAYLGEGLDFHFALELPLSLMLGHGIKQLDQFSACAMLADVQPHPLVIGIHPHRVITIDHSQQQIGHAKGPNRAHQYALQLNHQLIEATQASAEQ